jgi:hypothetical protein
VNRVGIVWVKHYSRAWIPFDPGESDQAAQGFAGAIQARVVLEPPEKDANDALFQGGGQAAVEAADVVYFSGHGSENGPLFADLFHNNGIAMPCEMSLGSGRLAIAVFDCCNVLAEFGRWKKIFNGLHYMLGFRNIIQLAPDRGRRFAESLRSQNPRLTIAEAWIRASLQTEVSAWHILRAVPEQGTTEDAIWSDNDPPPHGPPPPHVVISRTESIENAPLSPEVVRDRIPLFSTPPPAPSGVRLTEQAPNFDVSPTGHDPYGGWQASQTTRPSLEVAQASESIWFIRRRSLVRPVVTPPPGVPSRVAAIEAASAFLNQHQFQDARLTPPWISITEETHELVPGPAGTPWNAELHVNYSWILVGLPVLGPGARVRVTFRSPTPQVDEFLRFWREPQQVGFQNILTPEQAELRLREKMSAALTVRRRTLGYLSLGPALEQDYLLPVYRFEGTASSPGLTQDFVRDVHAVSEEDRSSFPPGSIFHVPTVL